jgi:dihydrofolate synthase / folylpolyglutamate synthase
MGQMGQALPLPENFRDCLDFFYSRNQFSIKLGLDSINGLLDKLGRPDKGLTILHVAGTNGKGSVCANLTALLQATGRKRVGLYTSPHLVSFRERIRIDGEPIAAEYIVAWLRRNQTLILELNATYFECITALALDYFKFKNCEAVVLETGLGGRLDATNAVNPAVTVITSISLDHTHILGNTVEEIWGEKIGILKPGIPMVVAENRPHLIQVLAEKAKSKNSPVRVLGDFPWMESQQDPDFRVFKGAHGLYEFPVRIRPEIHQIENLALSLLAMESFLGGPLPDSKILLPFLQNAKLPGRTQLLEETGRLPVLLDGAHNPSGMETLKNFLEQEYPNHRIVAIFSIMQDKDFTSVFRTVLGFASEVLFVSLEKKFPRALPYNELLKALTPKEQARVRPIKLEPQAIADLVENRQDALKTLDAKDDLPTLIVVCGSLYLLGEVIPLLLPHYQQLEPFRVFVDEY